MNRTSNYETEDEQDERHLASDKANSTEKPTVKPAPMEGGITVRFPSPPTDPKPKATEPKK
jgi:hypothetical protein